jgi:hypothetical protein
LSTANDFALTNVVAENKRIAQRLYITSTGIQVLGPPALSLAVGGYSGCREEVEATDLVVSMRFA